MSQPEIQGDGPERTAAALRASEERLRIAQAAGGVGTFEYISDGERMLVSPEFCRIWGVDLAEEAPIGFFMALIHPDDRNRVDSTHDERAARGPAPADQALPPGRPRRLRREAAGVQELSRSDSRKVRDLQSRSPPGRGGQSERSDDWCQAPIYKQLISGCFSL